MPDARPMIQQFQFLLNREAILSLALVWVSGSLMALATAPLNLFLLAWVALAPLWRLAFLAPLAPKVASPPLLLALFWGVGYHGLALSWILGLHPLTWLGVPWLGSIAIALFCWAFITLWGAALVMIWVAVLPWALGRSGQSQSIKLSLARVLVGTAIWCALEWIWSLGSLYWTSLSYTQSPGNLVVLHLGQLSGPALVTAAIVAVNGLLAEAWMHWQMAGPAAVRAVGRYLRLAGSAIGVFCLLHLIGFGLYSRPLADVEANGLKIGIIQGNVPTRIKLNRDGLRQAEIAYTKGYKALAAEAVDAVLTPEGALPYLWNSANRSSSSLYQAILQQGTVVWLGTFTQQDGKIARSLITLLSNGETAGQYNKIKLVPLGEYVPFQNLLGGLVQILSPIEAQGLPGQLQQRFNTPFGIAIASICYDSAFPEVFRSQAAIGGQFILTASNLDPYSQVLMAQHQAQDIMRAIETDRWAARATNTGYSGLVDPHGHVIWRSRPQTYEVYAGHLYRRQGQTLYVRWGDWLTPLLLVIAVGISHRRLRGESRF